MSDLTITEGGIAVTKKSGGEFLTADKKLNQMKTVTKDVTATLTAHGTVGDVMFVTTKIEDADMIGYTKAKSEGFTAKKNDNKVAKPPKRMKNEGFLPSNKRH